MEIRIIPGRDGSPFLLELRVRGRLMKSMSSSHDCTIVDEVKRLLDKYEGRFNILATWDGSPTPPPGR